MAWWKGNLHTHTLLSDGDSSPLDVARWYDDHGYDFLALTDHNLRSDPEGVASRLAGEGRGLLVIPGEEVTTWWPDGDRTLALHVGAINTAETVGPRQGNSASEVLTAMISGVEAAGGLAILNHPNFWSSVTMEDMSSLPGLTHFEIFNGHPLTFNEGVEALPSTEERWDRLLCRGRRLFGVAVDDSHDWGDWGPQHRNPGRGWVMIEAERLTVAGVMDALRRGRFYASTGPVLAEVVAGGGRLAVSWDSGGVLEFVSDGKVVSIAEGGRGSHPVPPGGYVRARLLGPSGVAWTQPAFG